MRPMFQGMHDDIAMFTVQSSDFSQAYNPAIECGGLFEVNCNCRRWFFNEAKAERLNIIITARDKELHCSHIGKAIDELIFEINDEIESA